MTEAVKVRYSVRDIADLHLAKRSVVLRVPPGAKPVPGPRGVVVAGLRFR